MIDHITLKISDYKNRAAEYGEVLKAAGLKGLFTDEWYAGFGAERPQYWIAAPREGEQPSSGAHIAIGVDSKELVDAFYAKAIDLGWKNNGAPGLRPEYHDHYYGAFVLDPDGNNIEAVYGNEL